MEGKYYADGEDAFDMRRRLNPKARPSSQQTDQEKQQQQSQVWPALPNLLQTAHCAPYSITWNACSMCMW